MDVEVNVLICIIMIVAKMRWFTEVDVESKKAGILCKNATCKSNANQQPGHPEHLPPLTTCPVSSSINFKAHGNIISVSTAIVQELSVAIQPKLD